MPLTPAQSQTFKTDILANTNTIPAGQPWSGSFVGMQVKNVPNDGDGNAAVAGWYNLDTATYWAWKPSVTRSEIYHVTGPGNTVFDWGTYKGQTQGEQGAWSQMFMGDQAPADRLNFRDGVFSIFAGGSGAPLAQRTHIWGVCRRTASNVEKLFAVAPANTGGLTVGPNNGNTTGDSLGAATNPAVLVVKGTISASDVNTALNLA